MDGRSLQLLVEGPGDWRYREEGVGGVGEEVARAAVLQQYMALGVLWVWSGVWSGLWTVDMWTAVSES